VGPDGGGPPLARDGGVLFLFSFCLLGAESPLAIWPEGLKFLFVFDV
jgi:hypothetical protein